MTPDVTCRHTWKKPFLACIENGSKVCLKWVKGQAQLIVDRLNLDNEKEGFQSASGRTTTVLHFVVLNAVVYELLL